MTLVAAFFLIFAASSAMNSVSNGGLSKRLKLESYDDSWESFVVVCLSAAPVKTNAGECILRSKVINSPAPPAAI